jgi:hypothetical protein
MCTTGLHHYDHHVVHKARASRSDLTLVLYGWHTAYGKLHPNNIDLPILPCCLDIKSLTRVQRRLEVLLRGELHTLLDIQSTPGNYYFLC